MCVNITNTGTYLRCLLITSGMCFENNCVNEEMKNVMSNVKDALYSS